VKVVDYFPKKLVDFSCPIDPTDDESSDEENNYAGSQRTDLQKWEWRFSLTVEDGRPVPKGTEKERLELYVSQQDAEYLLKLDAVE
jgi:hypothetical protein